LLCRVLALVCCCTIASACVSQNSQPTPAVQRDPAAVLLLESAVAILGGSSVRGIHDVTINGNVVSADPNDGTSGSFTWILSGKDFRFDNPEADGQRSA
jgi:hypothetical protein